MTFVKPVHYKLFFEPDLETFKFRGKTKLKAKVDEPTTKIKLHAADLEFESIKIKIDGEYVDVVDYQLDLEKTELHITLPENNLTKLKLKFKYIGEHNDKLKGFYRGTFFKDGEKKYCAVTQFQPDDARRAFPCVDVPGVKATYDIRFLVKPEDFAISNMPIKKVKDKDGKKLVKFETTPLMSSYLLFFGVGDFEAIEKESNGINYRVIAHPPNATKRGQFALDWSVKVVEFCEEYFDTKYPLPKLDQIATPSFAAGAMENWGAILYRENALLYYDGITGKRQENGILGVIAHEISHQWFGNLVSPETWIYVWLNESFATYFATFVLNHYYGEDSDDNRRIFEFYVQSPDLSRAARSTVGVMDWDSMIETSSIEVKGLGEQSYTAKTVPIIYEKGGAVLRQINGFLGYDGFRDGLRAYFKKHAYKATLSAHLWESLEEATGKPVSKVMESFVLQKGLPLITVSHDGTTLNFTQKRFTFLPFESDTLWNVPITIRVFKDGEEDLKRFILEGREGSFDIGDFDYYKINADMTGFYRVQYSPMYYAKLGDLVNSGSLSSIDKMNLEEDVFALLKAGIINLDTYLNFASYFNEDMSHMVIVNIAKHFRRIFDLLDDGENKEKVRKLAITHMDKVFEKYNFMPVEGEDIGISIIRSSLLLNAVKLGSKKAEEFSLAEFEKLKNGEKISADLRASIYRIGAMKTNDWDWFMSKYKDPESESEFINAITGLCSFTNKDLMEKVKDMVFDEIPTRNRGTAVQFLAANETTRPGMWLYYIANLDKFEGMGNFISQRALFSILRDSLEQKDDMEKFFEEYLVKKPSYKDVVDVGLEQLKIALAFKNKLNN